MKIGKISTAQLTSINRISLGLVATGIYFALVTPIILGVWDYPNLILGLTLLACGIINAHEKPLVLSGLLVGIMGLANLLTMVNVFPIDTGWMITLLCLVGVIVFEAFNVKIGPASKEARDAAVIPLLSLFLMFILAIVGMNPALTVDWATQQVKFINYVFLMFFSGLLSLQFLGWKPAGKNQGKWVTILGLLCIVTSAYGVYQGTLAW